MVERTEVTWIDDIDGSPAQHTIPFALDGVHYAIDLNPRHAQQLRDILRPYIQRARTITQSTGSRTQREQDRDRRRTRQANRALTEHIRNTAQRTRQHTTARTESTQATHQRPATERREATTSPPHPDAPPETSEQPRPPMKKALPISPPSVPVPQFSSPSGYSSAP